MLLLACLIGLFPCSDQNLLVDDTELEISVPCTLLWYKLVENSWDLGMTNLAPFCYLLWNTEIMLGS